VADGPKQLVDLQGLKGIRAILEVRHDLADKIQTALGAARLFPHGKFILVQLREQQVAIKALLDHFRQGLIIEREKGVPFIRITADQVGDHEGLET